jgi:hypothetical protein
LGQEPGVVGEGLTLGRIPRQRIGVRLRRRGNLEDNRPGFGLVANPGVSIESVQPLPAITTLEREAGPGAVEGSIAAKQSANEGGKRRRISRLSQQSLHRISRELIRPR